MDISPVLMNRSASKPFEFRLLASSTHRIRVINIGFLHPADGKSSKVFVGYEAKSLGPLSVETERASEPTLNDFGYAFCGEQQEHLVLAPIGDEVNGIRIMHAVGRQRSLLSIRVSAASIGQPS